MKFEYALKRIAESYIDLKDKRVEAVRELMSPFFPVLRVSKLTSGKQAVLIPGPQLQARRYALCRPQARYDRGYWTRDADDLKKIWPQGSIEDGLISLVFGEQPRYDIVNQINNFVTLHFDPYLTIPPHKKISDSHYEFDHCGLEKLWVSKKEISSIYQWNASKYGELCLNVDNYFSRFYQSGMDRARPIMEDGSIQIDPLEIWIPDYNSVASISPRILSKKERKLSTFVIAGNGSAHLGDSSLTRFFEHMGYLREISSLVPGEDIAIRVSQ